MEETDFEKKLKTGFGLTLGIFGIAAYAYISLTRPYEERAQQYQQAGQVEVGQHPIPTKIQWQDLIDEGIIDDDHSISCIDDVVEVND